MRRHFFLENGDEKRERERYFKFKVISRRDFAMKLQSARLSTEIPFGSTIMLLHHFMHVIKAAFGLSYAIGGAEKLFMNLTF